MKSIILAAGEGKRLRPLTENIPKCLVKLFGKSLLEQQIDTFKKCNIFDISVVTGYKADSIKIPGLKIYKNSDYSSTNMVETLFCAKNEMVSEVIVSYGDIIFESRVLEKLIDSEDDVSIIIDKEWEKYWKIRFDDPLEDVETLLLDKNNYILDLGQKPKSLDEIQGQYIGLMKFQGKGLEFMLKYYDDVKGEFENTGKNCLNPNLEFRKSYMTDFLRGMISEGCKIKGIPINNGWLEVDSVKDFQTYSRMYDDKTLNPFFSINS
ncbi:NTP transferase domain-containing protein [Candidatus Nitrosopumilus sp. SW]|uniref:phosphocholine cytidylyltransferase family protein n=1 Tax=Candidatus Nitrosopumilus sp. SW TaxID=2508726 RepID=UPI00163A7CFB|nr:phosphocholine cytidylyltransferase family protein [Candidatus Nitrosopumilus sp. SW]